MEFVGTEMEIRTLFAFWSQSKTFYPGSNLVVDWIPSKFKL